jgi:DNA polymerase-3 subunit gamma/tau
MLAFNQSETATPAIKASGPVSNQASSSSTSQAPRPSASAALKAVEVAPQIATLTVSEPAASAPTISLEPEVASSSIEASPPRVEAQSDAYSSEPSNAQTEAQNYNNDAFNESASMQEEAIEQRLETSAEQYTVQFNGNWRSLVDALKLGLARTLAQNCELESFDDNNIKLTVPDSQKHLLDPNYQDKLSSAINQHFGRRIQLNLRVGGTGNTTAKQIFEEKAIVQSEAESAIQQDDFVQALMKDFGANIIPSSIKPI